MKHKILILDEGEVILSPDLTYEVYGETLTADELLKVDFSHLPWIDQITLLQDIETKQEVIMLYHPVIVASIFKDHEASEYWGKNHFDCLTIFKRNATNTKVDLILKRKLSKPVETNNPSIKVNKSNAISALVKLGYDRKTAKLHMSEFLAENGIGYLNLTPLELANYVDEFVLR